MDIGLGALAKRRQLLGVIVAAGILAAVFVPFQKASAFTVEIDLPDSDDDTVSQSAAGESFEIVIDVAAGELISIGSIELILDNDESSVKRAIFNSTGDLTSGSNNFVIGNELTISSFSANSGYGYGVGLVSDGTTYSPLYSYSFSSNTGFIGGNNLGYSNAAGGTNFVTGLIGPGTITISGSLRTATLADGTHSLDVLIDTGAGGNDEDQLTGPALSFTVQEDDSVIVAEEEVASGSDDAEIDTTDSDGNAVEINLSFGASTTATGDVVVTVQNVEDFIDANTEEELEDLGLVLDGDDLTFTVDGSDDTFIAAGFILDIDISALGLPDGTEVTLSMTYDETGLSESDEEDIRLMHLPDGSAEWEALTNDDETINDGDEVDTDNNLVYGTTDSFSLFGPAVQQQEADDDDDEDNGSSGGGGGGRSSSGGISSGGPVVFPLAYFEENPLAKFTVRNSAFLNAAGAGVSQVTVGEQISISSLINNHQPVTQNYAFIVQIVDEDGYAIELNWQQNSLESGKKTQASMSWIPPATGNYTVKVFMWNAISESPIPLSDVTVRNLKVVE